MKIENIPDPGPTPDELAEQPEPDEVRKAQREVLENLFVLLDTKNHGPNAGLKKTLDTSFRKYVALIWLIRPGMLGYCTQKEVAKALGMSKAGFNRRVNRIAQAHPHLRNMLMRHPKGGLQKPPPQKRQWRTVNNWLIEQYAKDHVKQDGAEWVVIDPSSGEEISRGSTRWMAICKAAKA